MPRTSEPKPAEAVPPDGVNPAAWREAQRIDALLRRAQDGDPTALPAVRKILDADPGLWRTTGDLAFQAEATWLKTISGKDEVAKECFARKAKALRRELAGASASPLERLLAGRIVLCWIAVHHAEIVHAQTMQTQTFAQGEYYQERLDRAQKRYLAAIKALAQLRRVAITAVRVSEPDGRRTEAIRAEGARPSPPPPPPSPRVPEPAAPPPPPPMPRPVLVQPGWTKVDSY